MDNNELKTLITTQHEDVLINTETQINLLHQEYLNELDKMNKLHIKDTELQQQNINNIQKNIDDIKKDISDIKKHIMELHEFLKTTNAESLNKDDFNILNNAYVPIIGNPFFNYSRIRNLKIRKNDGSKFMPEEHK